MKNKLDLKEISITQPLVDIPPNCGINQQKGSAFSAYTMSEDKRKSISDSIDNISVLLSTGNNTESRCKSASEPVLATSEGIIHNNEEDDEECILTVESNKGCVKESKSTVEHEVMVSIVKPLTSPEEEQNEGKLNQFQISY